MLWLVALKRNQINQIYQWEITRLPQLLQQAIYPKKISMIFLYLKSMDGVGGVLR